MGWLFGWNTRKELVDHLCEGNGVKTLKRCFKGNNMWAVQQTEDGLVFAVLYLIKGRNESRDGWGYKDVDETMGPYQHDFPVSWLDLLSPCDSEYAVSWRENVRKRAEQMARFKIGTTWAYAGHEYTIIERRSPTSFRVKNEYGDTWRMKMSQLLHAEEAKK